MLTLLVALPFIAATLLFFVPERFRIAAASLAGAVALGGTIAIALQFSAVAQGEVVQESRAWLPQLGLYLSFRMDGFAWFFATLVLGIGALIVLYASYYLAKDDPAVRFFAFFLCFMGAMLGVVLAGNLLLLVFFWELTSLSSFLLIGYWRHRADARQGARMALTITGSGGLAMLAGVILIGQIVGSFELGDVLAARDQLQAHALFPVALVLVLLGALTKSAQFPFHFWLPHAMAAPTPVSAYLHSATMVKAGVFLLARLWPVLAGNEWWFWIVSSAGLATLVLGAYAALFQHDLKGLLAYSTLSHLGLITLLLGLNSPLAAVAAVFHIINHATFKASLFMAAGIIDHETGSRDLRQLSGLFRLMPITATLAMVASAAMAGVPLLNGFLSKEMFLAETLTIEGSRFIQVATPILATIAATFSVAYSLRFVHAVFFNGPSRSLPKTPHEPPWGMRIPVEGLVVLCVVVGLFPALTVGPVLAVAAAPVVGGTLPAYSLSIWHGFNLPLLMSVIALAGGIALYFALQRRVNLERLSMTPLIGWSSGKATFDALMSGLVALSRVIETRVRTQRLAPSLRWVLLLTLAVSLPVVMELRGLDTLPVVLRPMLEVPFAAGLVWAMLIAGCIASVVLFRQRLLAVISVGLVGLGVSLAFVFFSAPDLALTQLLVEVASIILLILALQHLPAEGPARDNLDVASRWPAVRLFDALISIALGLVVAVISYLVMRRPNDASISPFYLERSIPEGGGANAVNVIIVDFRGLDTLGEIGVLGIAGLLVAALMSHLQGPGSVQVGRSTHAGAFLLGLVTRLLLPATALIAIYFYLRGHNLPGGGFIGGLVLAVGITMLAVGHNSLHQETVRPINLEGWLGFGIVCAVLTGVGSWFMGYPFLTSATRYFPWPVVGDVPIASAMFFDLGVFTVVVGGCVLMLLRLARLRSA
jgi:multicomponent K+:H+ antiporter subunit A